MDTDASQPNTPPKPALSRTDLTAAVISFVVAALALTGHLPTGMDTDDAIALGAGLAAVGAFVRMLWERRAELTRQTVLTNAQEAAELFRLRLAEVRARQSYDRDRLTQVVDLAKRAADPNDPTQLRPEGLLSLLNATDPDADTAPIDTPPTPPAA